MANGIPSFAELFSGASIGNRIAGMAGSLDMYKQALADAASFEAAGDYYEDQFGEREEQGRKREKKRGKGRTIGAILGAGLATVLTGGAATPLLLAAGAGAGSYIGQRVTDGGVSLRTPFGDQRRARLKDIQKADVSNTFFRQDMARSLEKSRNKMNSYLRSANDRYDQSIIASALSDTLTAYQLGGLDYSKAIGQIKNLKHLPAVAKGDMSVQTFRGLQDMASGKSKSSILRDRFGIGTKAPGAIKKIKAPTIKSLSDPRKHSLFQRKLSVPGLPSNANDILKALEKPAQAQVSNSGVDNLYRNIINRRILEG